MIATVAITLIKVAISMDIPIIESALCPYMDWREVATKKKILLKTY